MSRNLSKDRQNIYLPHGTSTINYHVLPTCISDTTSHALGQEELNDGNLGELCGRHSDLVEEYVIKNKKKKKKNEKILYSKYEFLFTLFCASVKTFQQTNVCEKSQVSFDPQVSLQSN
jgi:hypothetical protein